MAGSLPEGPLEGLRVIEVGDRGEIAGKLLADAGADLIRVEPPGGARSRGLPPFVDDDPAKNSLSFAARNTSKRSVTLDLAAPGATALWAQLVGRADVVIDSHPPAALDQLNAGWDAVGHERLIWCAVTPFGREGPRSDWLAPDLVGVALGGPMMSTGYDDHDLPPIRAEGEHSMAMSNEYAVGAILAALWQRDALGGPGQLVDLSIHESISATVEGAFPNWEYLGKLVQRQTGRHSSPDPHPPWQYRCTDGNYILLMGGGIPRDRRNWEQLLDWMNEHEAVSDLRDPKYVEVLYTDPRREPEIRGHVAATIGAFVQLLDAETVYRRGQSMHLPWGRVRRPEENLDDPHWADRGFFWQGELPDHPQPVRYPGAPYRFTESPVRMRRRPPLLGEHNHEVYINELDLSMDDYKALAAAIHG